MEEALRKELHQIWLMSHEGKITKQEKDQQTKDLIHGILQTEPQRLLDLCKGHISGLSDERLLEKARKETADFVYMNISAGSYHFADTVKASPNLNSRKIKKIYGEVLTVLGIEEKEAQKILNKTSSYDSYNEEPAETILDLFSDEGICAEIDWKFALEDVEYNLNLITKKLNLEPIREYPPYEEGQPLGIDALRSIIEETSYKAVVVWDGDTFYAFLASEDKALLIKEELEKLEELWCLESPYIV